MKQAGIWCIGLLFLGAGMLHFGTPGFYEGLMPETWPRRLFNYTSGIAEIILGVGFLWRKTRRISGYVICVMLLAFWVLHGIHLWQPPNAELPFWGYLIRFLLQPILIGLVWKLKDHPPETV